MIDGKIEGLLISDIVIQEARSHFNEKAKALNEKIAKVVSAREYKFFASTDSVKKAGLKPIDAAKAVKEQFALFTK